MTKEEKTVSEDKEIKETKAESKPEAVKAEAKSAKKVAKSAKKAEKTSLFAVIKTGGKQYLVREGETLRVEKLAEAAEGKKIALDSVLLVSDNGDVKIGTPLLEGAKVEAR